MPGFMDILNDNGRLIGYIRSIVRKCVASRHVDDCVSAALMMFVQKRHMIDSSLPDQMIRRWFSTMIRFAISSNLRNMLSPLSIRSAMQSRSSRIKRGQDVSMLSAAINPSSFYGDVKSVKSPTSGITSLVSEEDVKTVNDAASSLHGIEAEIFRLRYAVGMSLNDCAAALNLTRTELRVIEVKMLEKICVRLFTRRS